jgi:MFS family permease
MLGFTIIWIGQMFSLLGTAMTGFALAVWAWEVTSQATVLALVGFFNFAPIVLASPIAGAIVDRYSRKKVMILADLFAGLPSVAVLLLYTTGNLQIWQLYITGAIAGTFQAFHFPAYSAAVTMMLPKEQYGRANGMLATAQFASGIFAPIVAALLLITVGLPTVLITDITTFTFAISLLLFVHIPQPATTEAGRKGRGSIWKESIYGFHYIFQRPSLLGLQLVFFLNNFVANFGNTLMAPMILARTGNDSIVLGSVLSAGGVGGLVGSIALTVWGGPKRRVHGVLSGMICTGLLGGILMGIGQDLFVWALASFLGLFFIPIINGSNQAIWQSKVAPDVQGRVFSTRLLIAQISVPVSMLLAGPLADRVFEPAMMSEGSLSSIFGWLVGTGPGAGMLLMFVIMGILGVLVGVGGYVVRVIRNAEDILPDHDATPEVTTDELS